MLKAVVRFDNWDQPLAALIQALKALTDGMSYQQLWQLMQVQWMNEWMSDNVRQWQERPKILALVHFLTCKKHKKISLKAPQISTGSEKLSPTGWRVFACQWSDLAPIGTLLISIKDTLADLSGHILSFDLIDVKYELDKIFLRVSDHNFRWNTLA